MAAHPDALLLVPAPALMSVDTYLRTNYSPDRDFVEQRNLGAKKHIRLLDTTEWVELPGTPLCLSLNDLFARLD